MQRWIRTGFVRSAVVALALFVAVRDASVQAQPRIAQSAAPQMPEIAGAWHGTGWGDVVLRADGTGSYSDTYSSGPGRLQIHRTGPRTYAGTWGESARRHGVVVLVFEAGGGTLRGAWSPDPECSLGTHTGDALTWTRR